MSRPFIYINWTKFDIVAVKKYLELLIIKISLFKEKLVVLNQIKDNLVFICYILLNLFNKRYRKMKYSLLKIYKKKQKQL